MPSFSEAAPGVWTPAIPLPTFGLRKRCSCGCKFWTLDGYRGHYALRHWPLDLRDAAIRLRGEGDQK